MRCDYFATGGISNAGPSARAPSSGWRRASGNDRRDAGQRASLGALRWPFPDRLASLAACSRRSGSGAYYFLDATAAKVVCEDVIGGTEDAPQTLQTCGPPRLLELLPFGLVIALLLWPDLSELGITGVVTLKRRLDQQEERQSALEDQLVEIQQTIMQTAVAAQGQSQAATTNVYYGDGYAPRPDRCSPRNRGQAEGG